jgi:hypothetical protein
VSPLPPQRPAHRQLPRLPCVGHTASQQVALRSLPRMAPPLHRHRLQVVWPNHRRQRTRLLPAVLAASNHPQPPPPHSSHTRRRRQQPAGPTTVLRRPDPQEAPTTHRRGRAGHRPPRVAGALPDRRRPARVVQLAPPPRPATSSPVSARHRSPNSPTHSNTPSPITETGTAGASNSATRPGAGSAPCSPCKTCPAPASHGATPNS